MNFVTVISSRRCSLKNNPRTSHKKIRKKFEKIQKIHGFILCGIPYLGVNKSSNSVLKFFFIYKILVHKKKIRKIQKNLKIRKNLKNSKKSERIRTPYLGVKNPSDFVFEMNVTTIQHEILLQLAAGSLYDCKRPGHFPYELDCIRFYRCFEVQPGVLKGLLYRCPSGYGYDSKVTQRCQKQQSLPPVCDRSDLVRSGSIPIPIIPLEDTTAVRIEDLESFFRNVNSFYLPRG